MGPSCPWMRDEKDVKTREYRHFSGNETPDRTTELADHNQPRAVLRFGDFEFDPTREELRESGHPVALRPQAVHLLSLLLQEPGRLMTREDIEGALWAPGDLGHEQGINACVREIRRALGDDSRAPTFIETVPKRGYRFIAPVEAVTNVVIPTVGSDATGARPRSRRLVSALLGMLTIIALVASLWNLFGSSVAIAPVWVAVAPVQHGGEPADARAAEALVTQMIVESNRLPAGRIRVTRWATQWSYNRASGEIEQDGQELGVDYVVESELRRTGSRITIVLHLFRVRDGALLWSNTIARSEPQILAGVHEAADTVVEVIQQLRS